MAVLTSLSLRMTMIIFLIVIFSQYFVVLALLIDALTHAISSFLELFFVKLQHFFGLLMLLVEEIDLVLPISDNIAFLLFELLFVFVFYLSHLFLKLEAQSLRLYPNLLVLRLKIVQLFLILFLAIDLLLFCFLQLLLMFCTDVADFLLAELFSIGLVLSVAHHDRFVELSILHFLFLILQNFSLQ